MIYYVEDDENIRELVLYTLRQAGMKAEGFESGRGLLERCAADKPALVLLDVMLPGEDGFSLLQKLKGDPATRDIQVLMITARGGEYDKVRGLDAGAEDYIAKPFGMMELLARVRAALRRNEKDAHAPVLTFGELRMDVVGHEVTAQGEAVSLTVKEYELLRRLLERPGMVFTREMLLSEIWGYDYAGDAHTVDVHVQTLRQKLGVCGGMILTVRGVGYKLGGPAK